MANATVQRFRKLLQTVGCYDIRITRHIGPGGRIQYTQYRVRFVEPVGHSEISGIFSLADMQRSLDAAPALKIKKAFSLSG